MGPYIPLAAKLGRLAMELAGGRAETITLSYYGALSGYDTRLLTVAATLKAQQRNIVDYVTQACVAALHESPAPSLLPASSRVPSRQPIRARTA